jgi:hypothetical protein
MRLTSTIPYLGRILPEDLTLKNYLIPAKTFFFWSPTLFGKDPSISAFHTLKHLMWLKPRSCLFQKYLQTLKSSDQNVGLTRRKKYTHLLLDSLDMAQGRPLLLFTHNFPWIVIFESSLRMCIGKRFAELEIHLGIAVLLKVKGKLFFGDSIMKHENFNCFRISI